MLVAPRKATRLLTAPAPESPASRCARFGDAVLVQDPDAFVRPPAVWEVRDVAPAHRRGAVSTSCSPGGSAGARPPTRSSSRARASPSGWAPASSPASWPRTSPCQGRAARPGAAAASDAFFPFPDGLASLADAGVSAVVQPGGSVRDAEVVAAADAAGIAMILTGERHFRH